MRRLTLLSAAALLLLAVNLPAQDEDSALADEKKLKDAYQGTDSKSILEFLDVRARGEVDPKALAGLTKDLDSRDASTRQKACRQLVAIGTPAIPKLRLVARDPQAG